MLCPTKDHADRRQASYALADPRPWFQYIDAELPPESPYLYGLHPNAEIGFLTQTSEKLFRTVLEMQPRDHQAGDGTGITREEKVRGGHFLRQFGDPKAGKWEPSANSVGRKSLTLRLADGFANPKSDFIWLIC